MTDDKIDNLVNDVLTDIAKFPEDEKWLRLVIRQAILRGIINYQDDLLEKRHAH